MDLLFITSITASFIAGMIALLAPCCITVVLPAYFASALKQRKKILKMTLIFFVGVAVVLIPIGLGAAALAKIFQNFHREMYIVGGLFMLILSAMSISGKGMNLIPMPKTLTPALNAKHNKSVFILGLFSGAATSCCAPVLAGAVALAVLSAAFWKALVVTFVYVLGMIFPLIIAAYFYDRFRLEESRLIKGKLLEFNFGGKKIYIHSTNLIAGVIFLAMGIILLILAISGNAFWAPSFQGKLSQGLIGWSQNITDKLVNILR